MNALPLEVTLLAGSALLLIVQIVLQAFLLTRELGLGYNASARDAQQQVKGVVAGRAERALKNLLETLPAFVGLAAALAVTGRTGGIGAAGAALWFGARVIYVPLYLFGVPYLRTVVWGAALVGLLMMAARFFAASA